jgi:DNA-binding transcriptional LysR family regulator
MLSAVTFPVGDVAELRVGDLWTFLAVARSSSLTAAARERQVTPSQVSKAITRIETHFGRKLLDRGSRGVALSETGRRLLPTLETVLAQLEAARVEKPEETNLTVGAPSYLHAALLPVLASVSPDVRLRGFELPPSLLRANADDERFELLLLPGDPAHLPASWEAERVGEIKKALFGSPAVAEALGRGPVPPEALRDVPFVCPAYHREGRVIPVDDDCPLPRSQRRVGHEVMTILVGLEVAAATDQVVFGPAIAATRQLRTGALVEIAVRGWDVRDSLSFAYHVDRVTARLRTAFTEALRAALSGGA